MDYDYCFKFILIGDSGVGKSWVLLNLIEKRFKNEHQVNIGVEFGSITLTVDEKIVKLQIWDTAGQEMFRSIIRSYYKGAVAAILVYDVCSEESFENLESWLNEARSYGSPNITVALIANKSDLESKSLIDPEEGKAFAEEHGLYFYETSAKTGQNIEDLFMDMAKILWENVDDAMGPEGEDQNVEEADQGIVLAKEKIKPFKWDENKNNLCCPS